MSFLSAFTVPLLPNTDFQKRGTVTINQPQGAVDAADITAAAFRLKGKPMNRNERFTKWEIILAILVVGFVLAYVLDVWVLPRL